MKVRTWTPGMSAHDAADLAYWERNVLALHYADGWYNDDVEEYEYDVNSMLATDTWGPRYRGWRRVLTLEGGEITFHIPDDFEVGSLPEVFRNWNGHTTGEKWALVLGRRGVTIQWP